MRLRRPVLPLAATTATLAIVAGCTSGSNGTTTPSVTETVTTTATASASAPPSGGSSAATTSAPPTGSGSSSAASGPGLCTPTVMTFDVTASEGAAGSSYFLIRATNASASPCVTTGFPGVALLDANGKTILNATRGEPSEAKTLVVAPGERITSQVRAANAGDGSQVCPISPKFLLTLPDNTDSTTITHATPACSVGVTAFVKGDGS